MEKPFFSLWSLSLGEGRSSKFPLRNTACPDMAGDSDGENPNGNAHSCNKSSYSSSSVTSSGSLCGRCSSFSPRASSAMDSLIDGRRLLSLSSRKPHRSSDPAWAAIRSIGEAIGPKDFKLVRRLGSGDIGTVYLCRLREDLHVFGCPSYYAMKVVNRRELARKKKLGRADAERRVLSALDHPFLPTLYADFDAPPHFSCAIMEFCSGGDLYTLRHRQPSKRFPLSAVRFYAAEVLLALEYLHMLGIVYRDLKPENVLIRSDGHIMLSDFDLCLESTASPSVRCSPDFYGGETPWLSKSDDSKRPLCLPQLLFQFTRLWRKTKDPSRIGPDSLARSRSSRSSASSVSSRLFVAEPVEARSCSFVGTHEYVSPEVAAGGAHGAAVDWWAFGIFLYELAYGFTPFAGATNTATLRNIVRSPLTFPPQKSPAENRLREMISALLEKDPTARLGSSCGAAELKSHSFFDGLNFALLRSQPPPTVPGAPMHAARSKSCREQRDPSPFKLYF